MEKEEKLELDIEAEAAKVVSDMWTNNEDATVFITERVAFQMKNLIRNLRKNYWGIFDKPKDPITGENKVWIPVTESTVDSVVKNIDLDTKDINFKAKKFSSIPLTGLVRAGTKNVLDKMTFNGMKFGELLDVSERNLGIDGTYVWKTVEGKDKDGNPTLDVSLVNLLNFSIDATASNIQDAEGVVERAVITKGEFDRMDISLNRDKVILTDMPSKNDSGVANFNPQSTQEYVTLYEYWGLMPKSFITGKSKDSEEMIEGKILCSGGSTGSAFVVHDIEENIKGYRPYEECWYRKVADRWYGKGVAEKVMMLQTWINTIVNIRINRHRLSQLGLFKLRKGSGVTPQKLAKLGTNGVITLNNIDDLQPMVMQEASMASYKDEEVANGWVQRVTGAFEAITGETMPGSTPATTTVVQNRNAQSEFVLVKEGIGMFLERWFNRHALPIISKHLKKGTIIRITDDPEERKSRDERVVNELAYRKLEEMKESGLLVDPMQVEQEIARFKEALENMGDSRFSNLLDDIDFSEYDVDMQVTNEDMDKAVVVQNLLSMLQTSAQLPTLGIDPADVARQIFDLMGLTPPRLQTKAQAQEQMSQLQQLGGQQGLPNVPTMGAEQIPQQANTLQGNII